MVLLTSDSVVIRGVLPVVMVGLVGYLIFGYFFSRTTFDAPIEDTVKHGRGAHSATAGTFDALLANYQKYRNRFFQIREIHGDTLIVPTRYLDELKAIPENVLSFRDATSQRLLGHYTMMGDRTELSHTLIATINQNLTRNLNALMPEIHEECKFAFESQIGECEDWTEVNIFHKLVTIVALISGRVFIGPELNRDSEYMRCIIRYTMELFEAVGALQQLGPWKRWFYATMGWVPQLATVEASRKSMEQILAPLVKQRVEMFQNGQELPSDLVTWNMMNSPAAAGWSLDAHVHLQLQTSLAAIHTTSMTGAHALYDLAARPECIAPLREELERVMAQESVSYLSKTSTPKLKLLDSFCKESQRMNPLGQLTFNRKVLQPITLHDGTVLPRGQLLAAPAAQISRDEQLWDDANEFNPWRFAKLREPKDQASRHQFVSLSLDSLNFGYGSHACPGRFFANNELKVILTYVLAHYDIKMPDGQGRPKNIITTGGARPDTSKSMLMRKVQK